MTAKPPQTPWLHRYAVLVAACTGLLFVNGPAVSGNEARPLFSLGQTHMWLGAAVSLLTAGLAIWLSRLEERAWLRRLAWAALSANILLDLMGFDTGSPSAVARVAHTLLGQLFLSTMAAIAVVTSAGRNHRSAPLKNASFVRTVATFSPVLLFSQVVLGVAFRQGVMSATAHIFWALLVVAWLTMTLALVVTSEHPALQPAGVVLAVLAALQMLLGFAVLIMQSLDVDPVIMIFATTAHAATGAFTLAASVVVAIQVRRVTRLE